jgi:hypothetical protein
MTERWWICFMDSESLWFRLWCPAGMSHCLAFKAADQDGKQTLWVTPYTSKCMVTVQPGEPWRWVRSAKARGWRVLTVEVPADPATTTAGVPPLGIFTTCATVVAYCIGLPARVWLPQGLWRLVLANGGKEI